MEKVLDRMSNLLLKNPQPGEGRGSFPTSGSGGTLDLAGAGPGPYYRAPATGSSMPKPGQEACDQLDQGLAVDLNVYAVYKAVRFIQQNVGSNVTGVFDPQTMSALSTWQSDNDVVSDGVAGPQTLKKMFNPMLSNVANAFDPANATGIGRITRGIIGIESGYDPGAIGKENPGRYGVAQIHMSLHHDVSAEQALDPVFAVSWVTRLIDDHLHHLSYDLRDAVAAYTLGLTSAKAWIIAGRPHTWTPKGSTEPIDIGDYIHKVIYSE